MTYKDKIDAKRQRIEAGKPRKKQFGERGHKKTSIPYEESRRCQKLMSFDENEGAKNV